MKNYLIRYAHTSPGCATSRRGAMQMVRLEAGVSRLAIAICTDGTYLWRSQADKEKDDTGANAFAVVSSPAQQACR